MLGFGGSDCEGQREPSVQRGGQSIVTIRSLLELWSDGVKPSGMFIQVIDGHSSGDQRVDNVAQSPGPLGGLVGLRGKFRVGVTPGIDERTWLVLSQLRKFDPQTRVLHGTVLWQCPDQRVALRQIDLSARYDGA